MNVRFAILTTCALLAATAAANANPVVFTYTDTVASTNIVGLNVGDQIVVNVFADNGGSTLSNQSWTVSQTNGFEVLAGLYHGTFSAVFGSGSSQIFATDASGNVSTHSFYGTAPSSVNSDNFGNWTGDSVSAGFGLMDPSRYYINASVDPASSTNWSVQFAQVPEPATLVLFGAGLLGFAASRRRKRA